MPVQQHPRREWRYDNLPIATPQRDQAFTPNVGTFVEFNSSNNLNEVQTVSISSWSAGDSYTLLFNGNATASITYSGDHSSADPAASIKTKIEAITGFAGTVTVALTSSTWTTSTTTYTVTFGGGYAATDVALFTKTNSGCTVTVTETTKGVGPWTVPAGIYRISELLIVGGGAAGNGAAAPSNAGAGGAGGVVRYLRNLPVTPGSTIAVTIGAGGVIDGNLGAGGAGTATSIVIGGVTYTANGGSGAPGGSGTRYLGADGGSGYSAAGGLGAGSATSNGFPGDAGVPPFGTDSPASGGDSVFFGGWGVTKGGSPGYGGGGGGGSSGTGTKPAPSGAGGFGGGGAGGSEIAGPGGAGGINTGAGGGGGSTGNSQSNAGNGGSGYVAFYYAGI